MSKTQQTVSAEVRSCLGVSAGEERCDIEGGNIAREIEMSDRRDTVSCTFPGDVLVRV